MFHCGTYRSVKAGLRILHTRARNIGWPRLSASTTQRNHNPQSGRLDVAREAGTRHALRMTHNDHPQVGTLLRRVGLALGAVVLCGARGSCGPTPEEASVAVLLTAPIAAAVGWAALWLLARLWRGRGAHCSPRVLLTLAAGAAPLLLLVAAHWRAIEGEWVLMALWLCGTSYITLLLVVWRAAFWLWPQRAFCWQVHAIPAAVLLVPAILVLLSNRAYGSVLGLWTFPGWGGLIAGPLLLLAVIEALIRGRRPAPVHPTPVGAPTPKRRKRDAD